MGLVILVDVAHAAWHAWESRSSVSGAFDQLSARLGDFAAGGERVVLVADRPPYERSDWYPAYKAHRRDDSRGRDAVSSFVRALAMEWDVVGCKGHEADDVIAALVAESERRGELLTVITGDKDLWCLAARCHLRDIRSGATIDASAVGAKWGVRPDQLLDLLALAGDKADNVPGAAQVGPVGARLLLEAYGDLAAILVAEPLSDEQLAEAERELDRLRRARTKAAKAAKGSPGDAALEEEAVANEAVANEAGRQVSRDKALRLVHAARSDVEISARLVALREDLTLDFVKVFEPQHGRGVTTSGDPASRHEAHTPGADAPPPAPTPAPPPPKEKRPMPDKRYQFTDTEATREAVRLRACFAGMTGSGKTLTAIRLGALMVERMRLGPLYVVDTEHRSALRYAPSPRGGEGYRFKHVPMPEDDNSPDAFLAALDFCESKGAGVILIDSLSHLWAGIGGVLEQVDETTAKSRTHNAFSEGWKKWTPIHARCIERIMQSPAHVIFTLRLKTDWQVVDGPDGKKAPKRMGLAPVARDGIDYEPDLFFIMEPAGAETHLWIDKSRALGRPALARGEKHVNPGVAFADEVIAWLEDGEDPAEALEKSLLESIGTAERASVDATTYVAARDGLDRWMVEHKVSRVRAEAAIVDLKARCAAKSGRAA